MNKTTIELGKLENSCFVVMPFSPLFQTEYEKVIRPTIEELGMICIRGDEIYTKQRIMDDIWYSVRTCRLVVAELSGKNANVLYEVGLAHAIGKPVIIITRNSDDVPFDLKALRYLYYDTDDPTWGENLKKGLKALIEKVIENPDIENYLPGILKSGKLEFPEIRKLTRKQAEVKSADISGSWEGEWNTNMKYLIKIYIDQNNDDLSANAIITYKKESSVSVVQQIVQGSINGLRVKLQGVNYSFVERGNSVGYIMDNFDLVYTPEQDLLTGTKNDARGNSAQLVLKRL